MPQDNKTAHGIQPNIEVDMTLKEHTFNEAMALISQKIDAQPNTVLAMARLIVALSKFVEQPLPSHRSGRPGRAVRTPLGSYPSVAAAALAHGIASTSLSERLRLKWEGYSYLSPH